MGQTVRPFFAVISLHWLKRLELSHSDQPEDGANREKKGGGDPIIQAKNSELS